MEYNLNGYMNGNEGSGSQGEKGNGKRESRCFRNGMFTGVILCLLIICCVYTVNKLYGMHKLRMESIMGQTAEETPDGLVNDKTMSKLEVLEQAIKEYYYQEDVDTSQLINGMYEGVIASLGDPYST